LEGGRRREREGLPTKVISTQRAYDPHGKRL